MSSNIPNTSTSNNAATSVGKPNTRVDGPLKVTGAARYSSDIEVEGVAHAVIVQSTIANGRIAAIDTSAAESAPGVLGILTHLNAPKLNKLSSKKTVEDSEPLDPALLQSDKVFYAGQHIAVVIADTLERAEHAAILVRIEYNEQPHTTDIYESLTEAFAPKDVNSKPPDYKRGDTEAGLADSDVTLDEQYTTPTETNNPMAPFATLAVWSEENGEERLTLYDSTQGVNNVLKAVTGWLGLKQEQVRVVSHFVGGGFGAGIRAWAHTTLAALAALHVNRPVKLVLTREQMFTSVGHRPATLQRIRLGAKRDGRLTAIEHHGTSPASQFSQFEENLTASPRILYSCPNVRTTYRLVRINTNTPTFMRAPGESTGMFAFESAIDELAYKLNIDPLELRLRNYSERDEEQDLPFSSKSLLECYQLGAQQFGWSRRIHQPRSMRDGQYLIGYGMASTTYSCYRMPTQARARVFRDASSHQGVRVVVQCATADIGPGTYTVMRQIAADALGLSVDSVRFQLGDTRLPKSPVQGASQTVQSVGSAVHEACTKARCYLLELARKKENSPLNSHLDAEIGWGDGRFFVNGDAMKSQAYAAILKQNNLDGVETELTSQAGDEQKKFSMQAFGAHFVEVRVDEAIGRLHVARMVGAFGIGRVINPRTAQSQIFGGMVWGVGQALLEETHMDDAFGRYVNPNLGEYHVAVNADIKSMEAYFVDERDEHVNPLGVKGCGEIGIIGVAAAIANAVFHATGKRIRDLPITPDKLI